MLSFDGDPGGAFAPMVSQRRRFEELLAALGDDDWARATRCDGWSVQDVVAHLVTVNDFWAASVRAGRAGEPTKVMGRFDPAAMPPMLIAGMADLGPSEVLDRFRTAHDDFLAALDGLDGAGWLTIAETPVGHVPMQQLAMHALWDAWVHERDVALPLGLTVVEDPDEVRTCLRYAAALGPAFSVITGVGLRGAFAVAGTDPEVAFTVDVADTVEVRSEPTPPGAPCLAGRAVDLVESLSTRSPLPASTPPEWRGLAGGLATVFDQDLTEPAPG